MTTTTEKKAQHTPGPWHVNSNDGFKDIVLAGTRIVARAEQAYIGFEENKANARLIAAAPELYDACKDVETYLGQIFGMSAEGQHIKHGLRERVRAAIAKAEGN